MIKQRTLGHPIQIKGIGVHTGEPSVVMISPAECDTGIVMDAGSPAARTPARIENVWSTGPQTVLEMGDTRIGTIEHLMASLYAMEVDNALISVDGPEIPIMDGSARTWMDAIRKVGTVPQQEKARFLRMKQEVRVGNDEAWCELKPWRLERGLFLTYDLMYDHPAIGSQSVGLKINERSFDTELADARTFGFIRDLPMLQAMGLAKGSSIENTLVFSHDGSNNKPRWEDEPVRHKLVDALGDLYLLGYRINGFFSGYRSGHALNHALARMVINNPESWTLE